MGRSWCWVRRAPVPDTAADLGGRGLRGEADRVDVARVRLGVGDREAERHGEGLGAAAAAVGGGADVRLAEPMPALARDYEFHAETSEALIQVAMIHLMLRRLAKGGQPKACPC